MYGGKLSRERLSPGGIVPGRVISVKNCTLPDFYIYIAFGEERERNKMLSIEAHSKILFQILHFFLTIPNYSYT